MASLPFLKLAGLLVKTLAKPVSTRMKHEATKHEYLSTIFVATGQMAHQVASRVNVLASGYKFIGVKPLPKEDAMTKGINFLSETFIFTVAGTIITVEYARSEAKNAEKAAASAVKEAETKALLEARFSSIEIRLHDIEMSLPLRSQEILRDRIERRNHGQSPSDIDEATTRMHNDSLSILGSLLHSQSKSKLEANEESVGEKKKWGGWRLW